MISYDVRVKASREYSVIIGSRLLAKSGELCRAVNSGKRVLLITDSNVAPLYSKTVLKSLENAGYSCTLFVFEAGERSKSLATVGEIYSALSAAELDRRDLIAALGGGVCGDMAGFAAATWMRGMDYVQLPTTLLSQVDSSVGGKTGVNIPSGKNLIGAFYQPCRVIADYDTLKTLPADISADGLAEVVKTAAICDEPLFSRIEQLGFADMDVIKRCVEIKSGVVARDELENGERKLLNFGHTIGHAIERFYNYEMAHGRAVSIGMAKITALSEHAGITAAGTSERLNSLLTQIGLPLDDKSVNDSLEFRLDKKSDGSTISLAVLDKIGSAQVLTVSSSCKMSDWFEPAPEKC